MKLFAGVNEEQMELDIEERIREMERPGHRFPKRFGIRDYITVAIVAIVCLFLIIRGYSL